MSINITMPALSPTMEEGKLAKWHVKEGDSVSSGDVIAEIETDKATMEVEAVDEGKIGKIVVPEGTDNVKVNAVIAVLLTEGESAADVKAPAPAVTPASKAADGAKAAANDAQVTMRENSATQVPAKGLSAADVGALVNKGIETARANTANSNLNSARVFASPLAKRLAKEANIDFAGFAGSGPHGRVVKSDVDAVKAGKALLKAPSTAPSAPSG